MAFGRSLCSPVIILRFNLIILHQDKSESFNVTKTPFDFSMAGRLHVYQVLNRPVVLNSKPTSGKRKMAYSTSVKLSKLLQLVQVGLIAPQMHSRKYDVANKIKRCKQRSSGRFKAANMREKVNLIYLVTNLTSTVSESSSGYYEMITSQFQIPLESTFFG